LDSGGYLASGLKTDLAKPELEQRSFVGRFSVRLVVGLCYPGEFKGAFLLFLPNRRRKCGADEKERQEQ
jgi:hypothetical protein